MRKSFHSHLVKFFLRQEGEHTSKSHVYFVEQQTIKWNRMEISFVFLPAKTHFFSLRLKFKRAHKHFQLTNGTSLKAFRELYAMWEHSYCSRSCTNSVRRSNAEQLNIEQYYWINECNMSCLPRVIMEFLLTLLHSHSLSLSRSFCLYPFISTNNSNYKNSFVLIANTIFSAPKHCNHLTYSVFFSASVCTD